MDAGRSHERLKLDAGQAVVLFGVLVAVLLWSALFWQVGESRKRALSDAAAEAANLSQVLDFHMQRTIAGLDQTLQVLKAIYQRDPKTFDLNRAVSDLAVGSDVTVQVALVDSNGILVDSTVPGFSRIDLSDREHIRVHRAPNKELFVSKPVLGRASGKWSIQLTRRLDRPDGGLAGVLVVSMDPSYLAQVYKSVDVGPHGSILLFGADGVLRVGTSAGEIHIGDQIADERLVNQVFSRKIGTIETLSPLSGERLQASFRVLPRLPLAVLVGQSQADVAALLAREVYVYYAVGVVVTLVLGGCLAALYRLVSRQAQTARDLAAKKAELIASRERLKRYVTDLERIAEVAAHDLQEPLRRVVAYAQLLAKHAESALDQEGKDYVAQVVAGAQRMRKLVRDLESYVAVDNLPDSTELSSAAKAVSEAQARLAEPIRAKSATILVGDLPDVAADPRSLTEIFVQLLDNALRYGMPDRKVTVRISAHSEGSQAVFSVQDNGMGIEGPCRLRMFEIFHRLHVVEGQDTTGIGLATVRRIVERLGGRIWVDSDPGNGSNFQFTLPLTCFAAQPQAGGGCAA
jgi:signal transduction histidine kinase